MATQSVRIGWRPYVNLTSAQAASNLLDSYSGAAAAYSLRKIKSSYTGSAIRVRRSSDNTELNIGFDSDGNLDTYSLSAFVGSVNGFVTTWYDQSGNSRNFTQTTALSQPQIVSTGSLILENGKVSVNFDGTNHRMYSSTLTNWTNQGFSTYVVSKFGGLNSNGRAVFAISNGVDLTNGYLHLIYRSDITNNFRVTHTTDGYATNSQNQNPLSTLPTTQILISTTRPASGNINFKLNNTTQSTITANTLGTLSGNFILGNYYTQNIISNGVYAHQGTISEVIVYPNSQESNTNGINTNINTYYSIYPNPSSVWNLLTAAYSADAVGSSSLKTSLFAAYNGESNANDSKGTNNGTAQGGLTYGTGKIGNAFNFNGSNAYVGLPNNSLNFTSDFSISLWVYLTAFPSEQIPIGNYYESSPSAGNSRGWMIYMTGQNLYWIVCGSSQVNLITSISSFQNTWKQITITFKNGVGSKIYFDGNLVTSNSSTISPIYNSTQTPFIGKYQYGNGSSFGYVSNGSKIDALNIWNKELTQSEIIELYNSGNGTQYITDSFYKPTTNDSLLVNNGTAVGGLTYGLGKVGTAFQFNGTNTYVSFPTGAFHSLTTDFSVSAWVSIPAGYTTQIPIFSNISSTSWFSNVGGFWLTLFGYGIQFRIGDKTVGPHDTTTTILTGNISAPPSNTFVHIVATRKAGQRSRIYYNGTLIANNTDARNPAYYTSGVNTTTPTIGNIKIPNGVQDAYYAPNGTKIDGLSVWSKELTQADVTELYNSGNGKQYPN